MLGHDFVNYDDQAYVYWNPVVRSGLTPVESFGLSHTFMRAIGIR